MAVDPIPRFGQKIQRLRLQRRLSVQELADLVGTSYQSIWRMECGQQKDPSLALSRGLARALGVSLDYLAGVYDESEPLTAAVA